MNTDKAQNAREHRDQWIKKIMASDLTAGQKLVAWGLAHNYQRNPNEQKFMRAWASAATIGEMVNQKQNTVQKHLGAIRDAGWTKSWGRTTQGRGAHIYSLEIPQSNDEAESEWHENATPPESEWYENATQSGMRMQHRVVSECNSEWYENATEPVTEPVMEPVTEHATECVPETVKEKSETETFRDTYPKHAALHLIEKAYRQQIANGATNEELLTAAKHYAKECKDTGVATRFIKFPTKFLSEEIWRNYLEAPPMTDEEKRKEADTWFKNVDIDDDLALSPPF